MSTVLPGNVQIQVYDGRQWLVLEEKVPIDDAWAIIRAHPAGKYHIVNLDTYNPQLMNNGRYTITFGNH